MQGLMHALGGGQRLARVASKVTQDIMEHNENPLQPDMAGIRCDIWNMIKNNNPACTCVNMRTYRVSDWEQLGHYIANTDYLKTLELAQPGLTKL